MLALGRNVTARQRAGVVRPLAGFDMWAVADSPARERFWAGRGCRVSWWVHDVPETVPGGVVRTVRHVQIIAVHSPAASGGAVLVTGSPDRGTLLARPDEWGRLVLDLAGFDPLRDDVTDVTAGVPVWGASYRRLQAALAARREVAA